MQEFQTKKKYGQNFLTDKNLLSAICDDAGIEEDDEVLEIGAGMGALTEMLNLKAKKVVSFEIDKDLKEFLLAKQMDKVNFIFDDVMKYNLEEIENNFSGEYKLVANLPYYITSPILFKFIGKSKRLKSITVMVQKEVAERMVACPCNKDYGVLSVSVSACADAKIMRIVNRKMFSPPPNVDSAIVRLDIKDKFDIDLDKFFEFTKKIFAMRRKTLLNNLSQGYGLSKHVLEELLGEEMLKKRAENFSPLEIVEMFKKMEERI